MKKHNNKIYKREPIYDFRQLIEYSINKFPNNIAYKFKKNLGKKNQEIICKTYKEIGAEIKALGTALLNLNLENKKIALISNSRYEWCVSYLAITTSNMVVVPLDKALPKMEIENLLKRSNVDAVIYCNKHAEIFDELKENSTVKYFINMDSVEESKKTLSLRKLIEKGNTLIKNGDTSYENIKINPDKMSILIFTSGTTNIPKGVMLSQKNITSNVNGMAQMSIMYPSDTLLSFLPLHHTFECTITFLYGFYSGATIAFCDGLKYIAKNLKEYNVSIFVAVPLVLETIYKKIEKGLKDKKKNLLVKIMSKFANFLLLFKIDIRRKIFKSILNELGGNLRIAYFGAAAMNKDIIKGYNNFGISTVQGYGLTETSPLISAETDKEHCPGSVGIAPEGVKIKINSKDKNGIGEILVKGPNVMLGYYENEEETKKVLKDGWFYTGDLGYLNKDGYLFITGRKKEVIVLKNGENVYPADVEFLVNQLPYVKESILFPRTNFKNEISLGIKIVYDEKLLNDAFGQKSFDEYQSLIWKDIKEINLKLPHHMKIKEMLITNEELEKTTTQKIKRFKEIEKILKK